jgi:serine/threonine protein kinase
MVTLKGYVVSDPPQSQTVLIRHVQGNLLIDEDGNVRITDFGLISITESQGFGTSFTAYTERGSVAYMAPELFAASEVKKNRNTDVYAFGITMLEVNFSTSPWLFSTLMRRL